MFCIFPVPISLSNGIKVSFPKDELSIFYIYMYICSVTSVVSDSVWPRRWQPTRLPIPGILQARTLEWVAISFSNAWKWKVKVKSLSRIRPSVTPWTAAYRLLRPWDFPGKSTGVGYHCLLQNYTFMVYKA